MNSNNLLFTYLFTVIILFSCSKEDEIIDIPDLVVTNEENDFIYQAMNQWYLYKDEQPLLANDYFDSLEEQIQFINNGGTPEEFFELLKVDKDEFSTLNNNVNLGSRYLSSTKGFRFNLFNVNSDEKIGVVLQVYKGSNAERLGLKRGDLFYKIDGTVMTSNNFENLLSQSSFNLGRVYSLGNASGSFIFSDRDEISVITENLEENPIVVSKTLNVEDTSIGYLFYKYFDSEYSNELNQNFAFFKTNGVKNFVIDLRYNSGGSELALLELGSMLTGQFNGEIFLEERYNQDIQNEIISGNINIDTSNTFRNTLEDGTSINSLELSKLYVITSRASASSSELLIHCLKPYIDVVVIGDKDGTVGKGVSKTEMYDAPNYFSEEGVNSNHNYFLDLVRIEGLNKNGEAVDSDFGISASIEAEEGSALLELGNVNEKLLKLAIDDILGR